MNPESQVSKINHLVFANNQLCWIEKDNQHFVPLRPICEALTLDWKNQYRNLQDDVVLNSTVVVVTTVAQDGKQREMICIPLNYLNGWLFKINPARYEGERRERIIKYQKECYEALFKHFYPHTKEQLERKKLMVTDKRLDFALIKTDLDIRKTTIAIEKQAEDEAMRIFRGGGAIEDLDSCPQLKAMTLEHLEKLNKGNLFPKKAEAAKIN